LDYDYKEKIFRRLKVVIFIDTYIGFGLKINVKEDKKFFIIIINRVYHMRTLRLINLHCNKTDNGGNTKSDKMFLTVDNGLFHT
jgi:hypothetical protein